MRKATLAVFCRDSEGRRNTWPGNGWTTTPFRIGSRTIATNGHVLVWRTTRPADRAWPVLADKHRAGVLATIERHPGPAACRKPWPTCEAVKSEDPFWPHSRVYFPQKLRVSIDAAYRDRVARFDADVLYATPRSNSKPVAFVVGEWRGLLMPLRERP